VPSGSPPPSGPPPKGKYPFTVIGFFKGSSQRWFGYCTADTHLEAEQWAVAGQKADLVVVRSIMGWPISPTDFDEFEHISERGAMDGEAAQ
jgi:hypothetical protein